MDDSPPPLRHIRVLDASRILAGPFCGQLLGDLGAEVIKVERPKTGDDTREWGPPWLGPLSSYFLCCNRNKKAITLDLSRPEGVFILHQLAAKSDILLENFRADSAVKLGLDPARLHAVNPHLIVCSISGYGRTGPMRDLAGYDFAVQALSGLMSITGPAEGPPCKVGVAVTDILTGLYAAVGVLACLEARRHSGHGYAIDLALLDCAVATQVNVAQAYLTSGEVPPRQGNAHLQIVPYQLFATADGWLVLAVGNDRQYQRFCEQAASPDLATDSRFTTNPLRVEHRDELVPLVSEIMKRKTTAEWQRLLEPAGVPCAPVWTYADIFAHPQAAARGLKLTVRDPDGHPVDLIGSPFHIQGARPPAPQCPPRLGQDTVEVLSELLGLDAARLNDLRQGGII
jgi:crotonobetainyl-CoA:carnitine CoA-transferase CaiB-like acyl-CoA transferase